MIYKYRTPPPPRRRGVKKTRRDAMDDGLTPRVVRLSAVEEIVEIVVNVRRDVSTTTTWWTSILYLASYINRRIILAYLYLYFEGMISKNKQVIL